MKCGKILIVFGRLTFLTLMIAQCLLLASYPAKYQNNSAWYAFLLFIMPAFGISWWWITSNNEDETIQRVCVWFTYIWLGLVPMIGIVFGLTAEKLDRSRNFGPNELKTSLYITPLLLLLLLNTGADSNNRKAINALSLKITIDLFDGNELLQIVIDENVQNFGIPKSFANALLSFACITFLLSPVEMAAHLVLDPEDLYKEVPIALNAIVQVCHNAVLFGLRLGIWLGYGWNVPLFITKNVIMICVRCLEFASTVHDDEEDAAPRHAEPTAPPPPPQNPAYAMDEVY